MRLTDTNINKLTPKLKDYRVACDQTKGFFVKVTPAGRKSFVVDGRVKGGRTRRFTLGTYPEVSTSDARAKALALISQMQQGADPKSESDKANAIASFTRKTLAEVFDEYLNIRDLKPKTRVDYKNTMHSVFSDWLSQPINKISREHVMKRFTKARDERGKATAVKSFRILSALFNFALADEVQGVRLLTDNPVNVIKQKGVSRAIPKREDYLTEDQIYRLMHFHMTERTFAEQYRKGVTDQGINYVMLLLFSGMRRSEALRLRWEDVDYDKRLFVARDTKNGSDHYIPMSDMLMWILNAQKDVAGESEWVFPKRNGEGHMTEPKSQLAKICNAVGFKFRLHDLRRTFATHASKAGVQFDLIQKALNHKAQNVTSGYIISNVYLMRPVFDTIFAEYSKYWDAETYQDYIGVGDDEYPEDYEPVAIDQDQF